MQVPCLILGSLVKILAWLPLEGTEIGLVTNKTTYFNAQSWDIILTSVMDVQILVRLSWLSTKDSINFPQENIAPSTEMGTSKLLYYACSPNFNFKTACPLCMREQASTSIGIHASLTATAPPSSHSRRRPSPARHHALRSGDPIHPAGLS